MNTLKKGMATTLLVVLFPALVFGSNTEWTPSHPQPGQQLTITYDASGTGLADASWVKMHHSWNYGSWYDADMTFNGSAWEYTITVPADCLTLTFCFFDDSSDWDNNNGSNWIMSTDPLAAGLAYHVASNGGIDLYTVISGNAVHVAMTQAGNTDDRFVFMQDDTSGGTVLAPWDKTGSVLAWDTFLGCEGSDSWTGWFDAGAQLFDGYSDQTFAPIRTSWVDGGMIHGTVELGHFYATTPSWLYFAAGSYGTNTGDALAGQAPASLDADGDIDIDEAVQIEPCTINLVSPCADCDGDYISDATEIMYGASDLNGNGIPDECEFDDCNNNGIDDATELNATTDCDSSGILDECESLDDCDGDLTPDVCEVDYADCNNNGTMDSCDITAGAADCNLNEIPDSCDITDGTSLDNNGNSIPDECEMQMVLSLTTDESEYASGEQAVVTLTLSQVSGTVYGGQFALQYDTSILSLVSSTAVTGSPFTEIVPLPGWVTLNPGEMFFSIHIEEGQPGYSGTGPVQMGQFTFDVVASASDCDVENAVSFRTTTPPYETRMAVAPGTPSYPDQLNNLNTFAIDFDAPTLTCPTAIEQDADSGEDFATVVIIDATATDNCDTTVDVVGERNDGQLLTATYPLGVTIITWTATDDAGNEATCQQMVTISDAEAPVITCPGDIVQDNDAGECQALVTIIDATAIDNDGIASIIGTRDDTLALTDPFPVGDTFIEWKATDNAGLTATCQQKVTVLDAEDPTATAGTIEDCYSTEASAEAAAIAATTPDDNCTTVGNFTITADTAGDCSAIITVTVEDEAGNDTEITYSTRIDNTAPEVSDCPTDITVLAEAGTTSAAVTWTAPTATDTCSGSITPTSTHNPGDRFDQGTTPVTYTFVDDCGNTSTCTFYVNVEANIVFTADIELQGPIDENLVRCIDFVFYGAECDTPVFSISEDVTFPANLAGNSLATTSFVVPTGNAYTCVTAQDPLHSLISRSTISIAGDAYSADLTGTNLLLQGDLYDDLQDGNYTFDYIDIVDLGMYLFEWDKTYDSDGDELPDGNTPCGNGLTAHADINGDGLVDSTDYAFITGNYLRVGQADCCSGKSYMNPSKAGPRTSISIAEAELLGLRQFRKLDVNRDRIFDEADVQYIMQYGFKPPKPQSSSFEAGNSVGNTKAKKK